MRQYRKVVNNAGNAGGKIEDFQNILDLLEATEQEWIDKDLMKEDDAQYMVVGGMAVQAHQKSQGKSRNLRNSKDIDIIINSDFGNYFLGFLNKKVANHKCPINGYSVENKKGVLYITTDQMLNKGIRASLSSGIIDSEALKEKLYERVEMDHDFRINVIKSEYLIASKISGYSKKRPKDKVDTLAMVDPIVKREKASKGSWKFDFSKVYQALKTLYPTNSIESKELLKEFIESYHLKSS